MVDIYCLTTLAHSDEIGGSMIRTRHVGREVEPRSFNMKLPVLVKYWDLSH